MKKIKNVRSTIVTIIPNLYATTTKIFQLKIRSNEGVIKELIY